LAAALQAAKLKKTNGPKTSSGSPGSANDVSNGGTSNYGTVGRSQSGSGGGMASMMDEMQKTLARRRAKVDRSSEEPDGEAERTNHYAEAGSAATKGSSPGKNVPNAGSESPKPESHAVVNGNGSSGDLEVVKQEILREMRKEINKAKQEIIDVIRLELSRR